MRGAQGPGDTGGDRMHGRERTAGLDVYARRRLLALLVVVVLLALLVPRACGALVGSGEDRASTESGGGRAADTSEKGSPNNAPADSPEDSKGDAKEDSGEDTDGDKAFSARDAADNEKNADGGRDPGSEEDRASGDGPAENLAVLVAEIGEVGGGSSFVPETVFSDPGADLTARRLAVGGAGGVSQDTPEAQQAPQTASQMPSSSETTPATEGGSAPSGAGGSVEPASEPEAESAAAAVEIEEVYVQEPVIIELVPVEPPVIEPVAVASVPAEVVPVAPVAVEIAPVEIAPVEVSVPAPVMPATVSPANVTVSASGFDVDVSMP